MGDDSDTVSLELTARHAIVLAFVVGVFTGGFFVSSISGFTATTESPEPAPTPSQDTEQDQAAITEKVSGVDAKAVSTCMSENADSIRQEISTDRDQGQQIGVTGTPGFIVYPSGANTGTLVVGAQPYSRFQTVIERTLNGNSNRSTSTAPVDFKNDPVLGNENAPVTIVAWEDFQCPFCKRFEQNTFPRIKSNYIDSGQVRFVFKDFAFLGQDSRTAAKASQCVWRQVKDSSPETWWEWQATVFDNQGRENSGWASKTNLVGDFSG